MRGTSLSIELPRKRSQSNSDQKHQSDSLDYSEIPLILGSPNSLNSPETAQQQDFELEEWKSQENKGVLNIFYGKLWRFFNPQENNPTESSGSPSNGKWATVFLLLNTMIGSGILNQPQVFAEAGLLGGVLLYAICCTTMWIAQQKLLHAGIVAKTMDYSELARHCFGKCGGVYLDGAVMIGGFLALCSYLTVIGGEGVSILHSWVGPLLGMEISSLKALPIITGFVILPLCLVRHFGHLAFISILSILAIALVMGCVLVKGPSEGLALGTQSQPIVWFSLGGFFRKVGSVAFAFDCLVATFFAYESMEVKSPGSWKDVTITSMIIASFMCLMTGVSGYLSFRNETEGDILDNFSGTVFTVVKFMVVLHLVLYVPISFVVMRHSFTMLIFGKDITSVSTIPYVILTIALLGMPFAVVMSLFALEISEGDAFGLLLDVCGALTDGAIALTIPGLLYLYVMRKEKRWNLKMGIYLVCIGLFLNVIVPIIELL